MEINEQVEIKDSECSFGFKGVLCFEDENGKLIFKANNMILKEGRRAIYDSCFGTSNLNLSNLKVVIGYDQTNSPVSANDNISNFQTNSYESVGITGTPVRDDDNLSVKYEFNIARPIASSENITRVNWVGLTTNDGNTLLTRSLFNTIVVPPTRTIKVTYTIYF